MSACTECPELGLEIQRKTDSWNFFRASRKSLPTRADRGRTSMRFSPGAMVWTLFGWTPGLRQIVAGRVLECGCLAALYETWNGEFVEILDGPSDCCRHSHHNVNFVLNGTVTAGKRPERL